MAVVVSRAWGCVGRGVCWPVGCFGAFKRSGYGAGGGVGGGFWNVGASMFHPSPPGRRSRGGVQHARRDCLLPRPKGSRCYRDSECFPHLTGRSRARRDAPAEGERPEGAGVRSWGRMLWGSSSWPCHRRTYVLAPVGAPQQGTGERGSLACAGPAPCREHKRERGGPVRGLRSGLLRLHAFGRPSDPSRPTRRAAAGCRLGLTQAASVAGASRVEAVGGRRGRGAAGGVCWGVSSSRSV